MYPQRLQRKRQKGYKLPPDTICVTRGTKYGNPFVIGEVLSIDQIGFLNTCDFKKYAFEVITREASLYLFAVYILPKLDMNPIKGKNLACFCSIESACHADILLEYANK